MACRSGCPDGNHTSWGQCARAARIGLAYVSPGNSLGDEKRWVRENDYFAKAVSDGLDPKGVSFAAVDAAYRAAEGG